MERILGLDLGMASVGFALIDLEENSGKIIEANAHIFEAAETPKDGSSLAAPRREARLARRILHRRAVRKREIRRLLSRYDFPANAVDQPVNHQEKSVWNLRADALIRKLTDNEFARVLFHIAKRRGFQSNRKKSDPDKILEEIKDEKTKKEMKKALKGMKIFQEKMREANALTAGAYLATQEKKRNNPGEYSHTVMRDLLREEVRKIFEAQRNFGNAKATEELREKFEQIAFYQRPQKSVAHMVGYCELEPSEKRAPRHAPSSELFLLYSKLNNLIIRYRGGREEVLTEEQRQRVVELAFTLKGGVKFARLRQEFDLGDDATFNLVRYRKTSENQITFEDIRAKAENSKFIELNGHHALREALEPFGKSEWQKLAAERTLLNEIARILSFYKDESEIDKLLAKLELSPEKREALKGITSFTKTINLSIKAIEKILPFMQQGQKYDEACRSAGYHHSRKINKGLRFLPRPEKTNNPVVDRALAQTCKVVNAVIRKHGMPDKIHIELQRDLGKPYKERKAIERENEKNKELRKKTEEETTEFFGRTPSGEEIVKYRLWKEQQGFCVYTGEEIKPQVLRDPTATEIDHILPYSRSYDDSWMNKVLCLTATNREKGNRTPFEWLGETSSWPGIEVMASRLPKPKCNRILLQNFEEDKWKSRHMNDTRYISRLMKNHIEENLDIGQGRRVLCLNGALTAHLRGLWGFPDKNRQAGDLHHALDAIVAACASHSMVQRMTLWNKREEKARGIEKPMPPKPWETFREDVKAKLAEAFVSRMLSRKATGKAHEDTIKKIRADNDGNRIIIQRIPLGELTPRLLDKLVDKEVRNKKLYDLLKERLAAYDNDPKKAFQSPIYMPCKKGKQGPIIRGVNVVVDDKSGIEIRGGLASNGGMVRVDVFKKGEKYYFCPIYVAQMHAYRKKGAPLPNKAIKGRTEDSWLEIDESYSFMFSLYKNDLVKLNDGNEDMFAYYQTIDRSNGRIWFRKHDRSKEDWRVSPGKIKLLEKYVVDYFGNRYRVKSEKRM